MNQQVTVLMNKPGTCSEPSEAADFSCYSRPHQEQQQTEHLRAAGLQQPQGRTPDLPTPGPGAPESSRQPSPRSARRRSAAAICRNALQESSHQAKPAPTSPLLPRRPPPSAVFATFFPIWTSPIFLLLLQGKILSTSPTISVHLQKK